MENHPHISRRNHRHEQFRLRVRMAGRRWQPELRLGRRHTGCVGSTHPAGLEPRHIRPRWHTAVWPFDEQPSLIIKATTATRTTRGISWEPPRVWLGRRQGVPSANGLFGAGFDPGSRPALPRQLMTVPPLRELAGPRVTVKGGRLQTRVEQQPGPKTDRRGHRQFESAVAADRTGFLRHRFEDMRTSCYRLATFSERGPSSPNLLGAYHRPRR